MNIGQCAICVLLGRESFSAIIISDSVKAGVVRIVKSELAKESGKCDESTAANETTDAGDSRTAGTSASNLIFEIVHFELFFNL